MDVLNPIYIGIDVGQISDPTAISVAEVSQVETGRYRPCQRVLPHFNREIGLWQPPRDMQPIMVTRYTIRSIRRLPLNTSYPAVAAHIASMLLSERFERRKVRVLIDVTGVGRPIYDSLKQEFLMRREIEEKRIEISIQPVSFVHGEKYNRVTGTLGKAFLVSRMQSLLQNERIDGVNSAEMKATCDELLVYQVKISDQGKDTYGAKTGAHDDLATALGLSCLEDPYAYAVKQSERVY